MNPNPLATSLDQAPPVTKPSILNTIPTPTVPLVAQTPAVTRQVSGGMGEVGRIRQQMQKNKIEQERMRLQTPSLNRGPQKPLATPGMALQRPGIAVAPTVSTLTPRGVATQEQNEPMQHAIAPIAPAVAPVNRASGASDSDRFAAGLQTKLNRG